VARRFPGPLSDKQIAVLKTFAEQAVIAIENARLLKELRQRTDDLSEALEQQTATSDVLQVISSSPGELEPVFKAMLENATRICEAKFGVMWLCEGDGFRAVALHGPAAHLESGVVNRSFTPARSFLLGVSLTRGTLSILPTSGPNQLMSKGLQLSFSLRTLAAPALFFSFQCSKRKS
jgi:hypothetical protein